MLEHQMKSKGRWNRRHSVLTLRRGFSFLLCFIAAAYLTSLSSLMGLQEKSLTNGLANLIGQFIVQISVLTRDKYELRNEAPSIICGSNADFNWLTENSKIRNWKVDHSKQRGPTAHHASNAKWHHFLPFY
jgi:hypothetical protein